MAIPSECKMPDLSLDTDYPQPLTGYLVVQMLSGGDNKLSHQSSLNRRNFVRLVDKAWREYHESKNALIREISREETAFMMLFTNHIETCVNAVQRLFKLLMRIRKDKNSPTIPKHLQRIVETKEKTIKDIRHTIEHIDERIRKDEIGRNKPIMLTVSENEDGVVVSNYEIKFIELVMILEKMREIALYILTVKKIEASDSVQGSGDL